MLGTEMIDITKEPLSSFITNNYRTVEIIAYMKSLCDDTKIYNRMRLMLLGSEQSGKTSLLQAFKREGLTMNNIQQNQRKKSITPRNFPVLDISEWTYEKTPRTSLGPITFRTWDFGGQSEFQSIYQYFFTRRTLYILCWKMNEYDDTNEQIFDTIHNMLINIQTVAPGSSVILVGTHHDQIVKLKNYHQLSENFQSIIYQRFIDTSNCEKLGYPKVLESIEISSKTGHKIKQLCTLIYDIAGQLLAPNNKDQTIFQQRIPAKYIYLEEALEDYRINKKPSIVNDKEYQEISQQTKQVQFRDYIELQQATKWLHENGIILHFEDTLLSNYYFLDPQYLAELLAQLIATEQTNGLARHGLMKISELPITFQDTNVSAVNDLSILLPLLQKFDLAITWDNQHLIFPPLLPAQLGLNTMSSHCRASIISSSSVIQFKDATDHLQYFSLLPLSNNQPLRSSLHFKYLARIKKDDNQSFGYIRRFYHLIFIPTCFWSRLFTRLIGDKQLQKTFLNYFLVDLKTNRSNEKIQNILMAECSWIVCQTGLELRYYDCCLLRINQINIISSNIDDDISYSYLNIIFQFDTDEEQKKQILPFHDQGSLIEILICTSDLQMILDSHDEEKKDSEPLIIELLVQQSTIGRILTILMAHFDTLLEDWYPEMGTRFVQNSKGDYLVNRFIPCHQCLNENNQTEKYICQTFWLEALMMSIEKRTELKCEKHGDIFLKSIAPDLIFCDLSSNNFLIPFDAIKLKKLIGQGTFGTVFAATSYKLAMDLACKAFVPIDTSITSGLIEQATGGNKDEDSEKKLSLRDIAREWTRNPMRAACKAYITCRQELSVLLTTGSHPNIVPLAGLCTHPLSIILHYAPMGSLESILKEYKRTNTQLGLTIYQKLIIQIASAMAHLHSNHIIYLDLKSENVLVWNMPQPRLPSRGQVLVKLSDFSISRVLSTIGTKGFAGTEGYIAPEIVRFTGDELYTEKADIFSFSMLMYECLSLNHPFSRNKRDHARELILHGWRPSLTEQELSSPTLILDLMVACWSEHPNNRPSARDIHKLSSSLEFRHLMDIIEIGNREEFNYSNTLATVSYRENNENFENDDEISMPTADCWFIRQSKQQEQSSIVIVAYDQFNAVNQQIINLGNCEIRAIYYHQREHVILLADRQTVIYVYCTRTFEKLNQFVLVHHQQNGHPIHMTSLFESSTVFLLLSDNSIYSIDLSALLHRSRSSISSSLDTCYRYVANVSLPTFKILALPTASGRNVEIWCGCSLGNLRIIDVRTAQLSVQLSHHLLSGSNAVHLLCASKDSPYQYTIWTAMKTGSFVCAWNHLSRRMTHQLDCEQIIKRSAEDSNELTVDSILPTRQLVFIGLNTGHIIIIKSSSAQVLYTVHAYDQHVLHLFALSPSTLLPSTTNESNDGRFVTQFKYLQEKFEQHRFQRGSVRTPLVPDYNGNDNELDNISYMLAIGYGAKACQSIPQLQQYSSDAIFLQTWSLDDFIL